MNYRLLIGWSLFIGSLAGCKTGVRDIDFMSKQFAATINLDSTQGIDSTKLSQLKASKTIYSFSEGGKGISYIETGMISEENPFVWKIQGDTLLINNKPYAVQKMDMGFTLKSDSAKILLSKQP